MPYKSSKEQDHDTANTFDPMVVDRIQNTIIHKKGDGCIINAIKIWWPKQNTFIWLKKKKIYIRPFEDILTFWETLSLNVSYKHKFIFVLPNMTCL